MSKNFTLITILVLFFVFALSTNSFATDWKTLSNNLKTAYAGKIISIEQLNGTTCWVVLSPQFSNSDCVKTSESIGYYIRNATGGIKGEKPSIHVFKSGKHIAIARPNGIQYKGKLDIKNWNPSSFNGKHRP